MWFSRFFRRTRSGRPRPAAPRRCLARRLVIEPLEDRSLLSAAFVAPLGQLPTITGAGSLAEMNGQLFFSSSSGLFRTDGTEAGTVLIRSGGAGNLTNISGTLFFTVGTGGGSAQLWKSDGTAEGTSSVADLPGLAVPHSFTASNGKLFFSAVHPTLGRELYVSDGTTAGTGVVRDIHVTGWANVESLIDVNGTLLFLANDGIHGQELWRSDGTAAGTVMVRDIFPGGFYSGARNLTNVNGELYFTAVHAPLQSGLFKSDGTEEGTVLVRPMSEIAPRGIGHMINFNGMLYFTAKDQTIGGDRQLWQSDGTAEGTVLVTEVQSGDNHTIENLTVVDGTLFFGFGRRLSTFFGTAFVADELWKSDGTVAGTELVKNLRVAGSVDEQGRFRDFSAFTAANGKLFFAAFTPESGWELWQSDGTEAGTVLVHDVNPGSASAWPTTISGYRPQLKVAGGKLFFAADSGLSGRELWVAEPSALPVTVDLSWSGGGLVGPAAVAPQASFTINRSYTVSGQAAGDFTIAYFASIDAVFGNEDDFLLGTEAITGEGAQVGTHSGTSPAFQIGAPGTFFLFALLDSDGVVAESDEANNLILAAQPLVVALPTGDADLSWQSGGIEVFQAEVAAGTPFVVERTYTVSGGPVSSFSIAYWASLDEIMGNEDDMLLVVEVVTDPASLESGTHTGMMLLQIDVPGSYLVFAVLDSDNQVAEADESNNQVQALTTVVVTAASQEAN